MTADTYIRKLTKELMREIQLYLQFLDIAKTPIPKTPNNPA